MNKHCLQKDKFELFPPHIAGNSSNLPVGATGGSSTKLVAGMGMSSWPPEMSLHTNLNKTDNFKSLHIEKSKLQSYIIHLFETRSHLYPRISEIELGIRPLIN